MTYSILAFILMGLATSIMGAGTMLNSNNDAYSFFAGILFIAGVLCYGYDLFHNGKKDR